MKTYVLFVFGLILIGCSNQEQSTSIHLKEETKTSRIGLRKLNLGYKTQKLIINSTTENELKLNSGSIIRIQPNSFVDKTGKQINGKVTIEWNEFHSLGDVITSNITMRYDSLGNEYDFVTGGMFTINGTYKDEPVFIKKNKMIAIDVASINQQKNMNFYYLDSNSNKWKYITTKNNTTLTDVKQSLEDPSTTLSKNILDIQVSVKNFSELNQKEIFGWKTQKAIDKGTLTTILSGNFKPTITHRINDSLYNLKLTSTIAEDTRDFTFAVAPHSYKKAREESYRNQLLIQKNKEKIERYVSAVAEGKVIRSISISNFGTYNWDCFHKEDNPIIVQSEFMFPSHVESELAIVYFVCPEDLITINCGQSGNSLVKFNPKKANFLIAISSSNELLYCDKSQFTEAITFHNKRFTFEFKNSGIILNDSKDIDDAIENILI